MKYAIFLMMLCATAPLTGCSPKTVPVYQGPLFCDMVEPFRWTPAEWEARQVYQANLRKELTINEAWKAECVE